MKQQWKQRKAGFVPHVTVQPLIYWILCFCMSALPLASAQAQSVCAQIHSEKPKAQKVWIEDDSLGFPVKLAEVHPDHTLRGYISLRRSGMELRPDEVAIGFAMLDSPESPLQSHVFLLTPQRRVDGGILMRPHLYAKNIIGNNTILFRFSGLSPEDMAQIHQAIQKMGTSKLSLPKLTCVHAACSILKNGPPEKVPTETHIYISTFFDALLKYSQNPSHQSSVTIEKYSELPLENFFYRFQQYDAFEKDDILTTVKLFSGMSISALTYALYHWFY